MSEPTESTRPPRSGSLIVSVNEATGNTELNCDFRGYSRGELLAVCYALTSWVAMMLKNLVGIRGEQIHGRLERIEPTPDE